MIAEAHPCDENGGFLVDIDFQFENVGESGFRIQGNGVDYGDFSYEEAYVTIGPLYGDGQTVYEFVIIDNDNPNCQDYTTLGPIDCDPNQGPCEIYNLVVDPMECNENGTYSIAINFEVENPGNNFFEVFGPNNEYIGYYPIADLPVVIENYHPHRQRLGLPYRMYQRCAELLPRYRMGSPGLRPQ